MPIKPIKPHKPKKVKVFITKNAFSTGILTRIGTETTGSTGTKYFRSTERCNGQDFSREYRGTDYQLTKKEALDRVEVVRNQKLESLRRQIQTLIDFEVKFIDK